MYYRAFGWAILSLYLVMEPVPGLVPPKSGPEPRFELEPLRTGPLVQSQVWYFCWTEPPNRSEVRYFPGAREPVQTRPDRFEPDVFLSNLDSQTGNEASCFW
jgi:hypothetical protein